MLMNHIVFLLFVAAMSLILPLLKATFLPGNIRWINPANHTLIETFGSLISLIIGMILAWEYLTSGKTNILFLVYAFFSISILDFFHAFADYFHNLFVWYHSLGTVTNSRISKPNAKSQCSWYQAVIRHFRSERSLSFHYETLDVSRRFIVESPDQTF